MNDEMMSVDIDTFNIGLTNTYQHCAYVFFTVY